MKKNSSIFFDSLTETECENLRKEVDEVLAVGFNLPRRKIFTTTDLWNIERHRRSRVQRRFLM
jgi:hypothetical protein